MAKKGWVFGRDDEQHSPWDDAAISVLPSVAWVLGVSVAYLVGKSAETIPANAADCLTPGEVTLLTKIRALPPADKSVIARIGDTFPQASVFSFTKVEEEAEMPPGFRWPNSKPKIGLGP